MHITEFYTYLQTVRDHLRLLSGIKSPQRQSQHWCDGLRNIIYAIFLMLESARHALEQAIEDEPEQAQNVITILISELVLYGFLLKECEAEAQTQPDYSAKLERLRLRKHRYGELARKEYARANSKRTDEEWKPAAALTRELNACFRQVFGRDIEPAVVM